MVSKTVGPDFVVTVSAFMMGYFLFVSKLLTFMAQLEVAF
jgi:hypothetical protein